MSLIRAAALVVFLLCSASVTAKEVNMIPVDSIDSTGGWESWSFTFSGPVQITAITVFFDLKNTVFGSTSSYVVEAVMTEGTGSASFEDKESGAKSAWTVGPGHLQEIKLTNMNTLYDMRNVKVVLEYNDYVWVPPTPSPPMPTPSPPMPTPSPPMPTPSPPMPTPSPPKPTPLPPTPLTPYNPYAPPSSLDGHSSSLIPAGTTTYYPHKCTGLSYFDCSLAQYCTWGYKYDRNGSCMTTDEDSSNLLLIILLVCGGVLLLIIVLVVVLCCCCCNRQKKVTETYYNVPLAQEAIVNVSNDNNNTSMTQIQGL